MMIGVQGEDSGQVMALGLSERRCVQGEDSGQVHAWLWAYPECSNTHWAYLAHAVRSSIVTSTLQEKKLSSNDKRRSVVTWRNNINHAYKGPVFLPYQTKTLPDVALYTSLSATCIQYSPQGAIDIKIFWNFTKIVAERNCWKWATVWRSQKTDSSGGRKFPRFFRRFTRKRQE